MGMKALARFAGPDLVYSPGPYFGVIGLLGFRESVHALGEFVVVVVAGITLPIPILPEEA
jgi:hypothetical protein